jgi:hypoxanthine phosphoribosyltransferase
MALITENEIKKRIEELGREISREYRGKDLVLIGVLKGSLIFLADLLRNINIPADLDIMCVETYRDGTTPDEKSRILFSGSINRTGRDLLIIEDIVDTGLTLRYIIQALEDESPNTLEICALLEKERKEPIDFNVKYVGFRVPEIFVIGYGMDYRGKYRGLPFIGVLNEEDGVDGE